MDSLEGEQWKWCGNLYGIVTVAILPQLVAGFNPVWCLSHLQPRLVALSQLRPEDPTIKAVHCPLLPWASVQHWPETTYFILAHRFLGLCVELRKHSFITNINRVKYLPFLCFFFRTFWSVSWLWFIQIG